MVSPNDAIAAKRVFHEALKIGMRFPSQHIEVRFRKQEGMRFSLNAHLGLVMSQNMSEIDVEISILVYHNIIIVAIADPCEIHKHHVLTQRSRKSFADFFNTVSQRFVSPLRLENSRRVESEQLFLALSFQLERLISHRRVRDEILLNCEVVQ